MPRSMYLPRPFVHPPPKGGKQTLNSKRSRQQGKKPTTDQQGPIPTSFPEKEEGRQALGECVAW
eukprot:11546736-Prorocentrum_lima.AAC.1